MENKFAVFKIHPGAQPQSLHRKAIPDFSKSIKDMGEFDFSLCVKYVFSFFFAPFFLNLFVFLFLVCFKSVNHIKQLCGIVGG